MTKYGLLDPMPLDNGEEPRELKCAGCGLPFNNDIDPDDYFCIDKTGMCHFCDKNSLNNE